MSGLLDDPRLPDSFWSRVAPEPTTGCWLWTAGVSSDGYAHYRFAGRTQNAHRLAYEELTGAVPAGLVIDHLCRVRCCVNPAHMEPVTRRENTLRGETVPAALIARTHCNHGHDFTPENTGYFFRNDKGKSYRYCRTCKRAKDRRLAARRRR